jgi:alkanesulfonate monooxygenase SsuD/methylene tetrahydromethanopterin reductase-like flavin-dependent oxidoreductase (luciferase family)
MEFFFHSCYLEPENMMPAAQACEEAGWYGFDVSDHIVQPSDLGSEYPYEHEVFPRTAPWPDPWVNIAHLSAGTQNLVFTNATYVLTLRHPLQAARLIATAAQLSGYRIRPAIAAGWMKAEFDVFGVEFATRFSRLDESIAILRNAWEGGYFAHHGKHFDFPEVAMNPAPMQRIPLWGSGDRPNALRRAARLDGYLGALYDSKSGKVLIDQLQKIRREEGTDGRDDFRITVGYLSENAVVPSLDECKRMEDMGFTGLSVCPFETEYPPTNCDPGLDKILRCIDAFANDVIARMDAAR